MSDTDSGWMVAEHEPSAADHAAYAYGHAGAAMQHAQMAGGHSATAQGQASLAESHAANAMKALAMALQAAEEAKTVVGRTTQDAQAITAAQAQMQMQLDQHFDRVCTIFGGMAEQIGQILHGNAALVHSVGRLTEELRAPRVMKVTKRDDDGMIEEAMSETSKRDAE